MMPRSSRPQLIRRSILTLFLLHFFGLDLPGQVRGEISSTGSRQFQAESSAVTLARKACDQAESIRTRFCQITGQPDHFVSPIRISFEDSELGDDLEDYTYRVAVEPGVALWTYSIRASKEPSAETRELSWPEAVVTALQYEMANRVRGKKGGGLVTWPAWFLWGIIGTSDDHTREQIEKLWASKYRRKTYRTLEQIWKTPPSVSAEERERIQVLSTWLIGELKRLPDGSAKFTKLTHEINRDAFSKEAFREIYRGDFASLRDAERWWTSRLAFFIHGSELASMDFDETTGCLRDILEGGLPEPGIRGLDQKGMVELNELLGELYHLTVSGHPIVRPAVDTAINALEAARRNDMRRARPLWKNAQTMLESLNSWRSSINAVLDRDEYQANQETSGRWLVKKGVTD